MFKVRVKTGRFNFHKFVISIYFSMLEEKEVLNLWFSLKNGYCLKYGKYLNSDGTGCYTNTLFDCPEKVP